METAAYRGIDLSRVLDDIEELLLPGALAIGGLYALYWTLTRTEMLFRSIDDLTGEVIDYDIPWVGEGDLIDRWTINPQEARSLAGDAWRFVTAPIRWVL